MGARCRGGRLRVSNTIYTDRSRAEAYLRCPRLRFLSYHQDGLGITAAKEPLPLLVGKSVHKGLESLLLGKTEDEAVAVALLEFDSNVPALDDMEEAAMRNSLADLGIGDDPTLLD